MRYLVLIKPLLLLVGALFGVLIGGRGVLIYLTEKEPTAFTAEDFGSEYGGQAWVSVRGRLAAEAKAVLPSRGRFANLYVPLVPADWQRADPVHVVVAVDRVAPGGVEAWAQGAAAQDEVTITGMVRPLGGLNYGYVFPRLQFAQPTITINEDSQPLPPWGTGFVAVICVALAVYGGRTIVLLLRAP